MESSVPPSGPSYDTPTPKQKPTLDRTLEAFGRTADEIGNTVKPHLEPVVEALKMATPLGSADDIRGAVESTTEASTDLSKGRVLEALGNAAEGLASGLGAFAPGPTPEQMGQILSIFAGVNAKNFRREDAEKLDEFLDQADESYFYSQEDFDRENVAEGVREHYKKTGQFYGKDGKIRQEILDGPAEIRNDPFIVLDKLGYGKASRVPLSHRLVHPELFEAYPEIKDIKVTFRPDNNFGGSFSPTTNEITVSAPLMQELKRMYPSSTEEELIQIRNANNRHTLLHEIQHYVQRVEGFPQGDSPANFSDAPKEERREYWIDTLRDTFRSDMTGEDYDQAKDAAEFLYHLADTRADRTDIYEMIEQDALPYKIKQMQERAGSLDEFIKELKGTFYSAEGKTAFKWYEDSAGEIEARLIMDRSYNTSYSESSHPIDDLDDTPPNVKARYRYAEGGLVPTMEDQTMEAFGAPEDPVSGNAVPPGGTAEGVRDDVDIKVSKGEYIIPEDVVRFIGVAKLEQLVGQVKSELQKMASNGRMGTPVAEQPAPEPEMDDELPFDPAELTQEAPQQPGFSTGGLVADQTTNRVGYAPTTPGVAPVAQGGVKVYKDKTGFIRVVPYVNGTPIGTPPEGAQEIPGSSTPKPAQPQTPATGPAMRDENDANRNREPNESYDINSLSGSEARAKLGQQETIRENLNSPVGRAAMGVAGGLVPGAGLIGAAQRSISQALADQVLSKEYNEESEGLLGSLLGGTRVGKAFGFTDRVDDLRNQDRVRDIRANYVDNPAVPSTTTGSYDRPTALAPERSPVPTARPDRSPSQSTPSEGNSGGGWGDDNQDTEDSMSRGGLEGPGSLY